ncbi:MAG TPA: ATP-binding protein, partial [Micromonosporaceae bacterium]|nr:ATP-binding protein [Micromonosporaceae bacterium]
PVGNQLIMVGFPRGLELGSWVYGRPGGPVATGWVEIHSGPDRESTLERGFSGAPVWDPDVDAAVGMVVQRVTGAPPKIGYMLPAHRLLAGWPGLAGIIERTPPFRGLRPFTEHDTELFFGREELTDRLERRARGAPVLCVVGPSGVGKSSLLMAGLLPRLRAAGMIAVVLRPSDEGTPLRALALAVDRLLSPERHPLERVDAVAALTDRFARGGLPEVASALLADHEGADDRRLLIAVDQFEEVFASPGADRAAFTGALGAALRPGSRIGVLLNLRDTFLGASLRTPEVAELAAAWLPVTVGEMSAGELRRVITGPLAGVGTVACQHGLVERILEDVQHAPGALPLLQFALTELWERRTGGLLTHAAYDELGGVRGALAAYAESVWDSLEPRGRQAAERLLVQLVRPLPDDRLTVRRTANRDELDEAQWTVAQRLATSRLLVLRAAPGPGVELAHESLLTGWERLGLLAERHREFRVWQEGLRQRRAQWIAEAHKGHRLLAGADLRDAKRWAGGYAADLSDGERAYIVASLRRRRRRAARACAAVVALALIVAMTYRSTGQQRAELAARDLAAASTRLAGLDSYGAAQLAMRAERTDGRVNPAGAMPTGLDGVDRLVPDYFSVGLDRSQPQPSPSPSTARWLFQDTSQLSRRVSAGGTAMVTRDPAGRGALWHLSDGAVTRDRAFGELFGENDRIQEATISRSGRYVGYVAQLKPVIPADPEDARVGADRLPLPVPPARPTCAVPTIGSFAGCLVAYDTVARRVVHTAAFTELLPPVSALSIDPEDRTMAYITSNATVLSRPSAVVNTLHVVDLSTGAERSTVTLPWHSWVYGLWLGPGSGQALVTEFLPQPGQVTYGRAALSRVDLTAGTPARHELIDRVDRLAVSLDWSTVAATMPPDDGGVTALVLRSWSGGPIARVTDLTEAEQRGAPALTADGSVLLIPATPDLPLVRASDVRQINDRARTVLSAWTVPGGARQAVASGGFAGSALHFGWNALLPLGRDPLGPVLVLETSTTGVVLAHKGRPAPLRRLSDAAADLPAAVTADRLCALMADPNTDQAVREFVPKDAYQGALCPS